MPLGHLLVVPGWRLGLLTEGKAANTNRIEAWTAYRGEAERRIVAGTGTTNRVQIQEENQGRHGDISQRVAL
jgi:hypothetical protein